MEPRTVFGSGKEDSTWHEPALVCARGARTCEASQGHAGLLALLTGALALVVPAVAAAGTPLAVASTGTTACTGFQDDFATDYPGTLNPDLPAQAGPVARAVGAQLGTPFTAPVRAGLSPSGWSTDSDGFSALQSTTACGGPFTFSTVFEGDAGLEHVDISLATADLSKAVTVEGNWKERTRGYGPAAHSPLPAPRVRTTWTQTRALMSFTR